jgi:FtsP/CotA-like multicopper oxidase with cupredoxin domain
VREGGHLEDAKQLEEKIGGEERREFAVVVGRRDFDEVGTDDVKTVEGANKFENLRAAEASDLRSAGAGSESRIDGVDVQSDVDRFAAECRQVALHRSHALGVKFFGVDHADFVGAGEVEIAFGVDLTAQADLQDPAILQQAFLEGAAERRAVRILAAEVFVPQIVVGVELDQADGSVLFGYSPQDGQADRVIATNAQAANSGVENGRDSLLDAAKGVFDGKGIDREIAEIGDAELGEGIQLQNGIPGTDDRGLGAHIARTETRTGAIGGAAVKRHADYGDVQLFGLGNVRETQESGDAGEAGVREGIGGLRMRQTKRAAGLRHGAGILVSGSSEVNARGGAIWRCERAGAFTARSLESNKNGVFLVFRIRIQIEGEMYSLRMLLCAWFVCAISGIPASAQDAAGSTARNSSKAACFRAAEGSTIPEPEDLRSRNGVLKVDLAFRNDQDANGQMRYCYVAAGGSQAPTLRVSPGDTLIVTLKNEVSLPDSSDSGKMSHAMPGLGAGRTAGAHHDSARDVCAGGAMTASATNLHFHGMVIPPVCHQDETLKTLIQPSDSPFEYRIQIPRDTPPGLYWYHPHPHGFSKAQVLGGASGALIVEGLEQVSPQVAGLPERVLVVRDQDLVNPNAEPVRSDSMPPPIVLRDAEGDILNTGTGGGKPAKDLSLNFVPVPFPKYQPAVIPMKASESQLWRVLNASAITYLDLQVLFDDKPQLVGVVALDGIPLAQRGSAAASILWQSHVALPPAGRVEFIVKGPAGGARASLVTRTVDTGPAGENDPTRPLAVMSIAPDAPEPRSKLPGVPKELGGPPSSGTLVASLSPIVPAARVPIWLGDTKPVRERKLYFYEEPQDPKNPNSPTKFFITVEGQAQAMFDPKASVPNIVARQGDVEDWIIENRTQELHAFHIHQIHFLLTEWNGIPLNEPFLRDTVNVAYWNGKSPQYPSVKLRMDFRDPNIVGTFVYHCHLLEHEDGGMMGTIRVEPSPASIERPSTR